MSSPPEDLSDLGRRLWGVTEGVLAFAGLVDPASVFIDRESGMPVLPVPTAVVVSGEEVALLSPEETPDALTVLGVPEELSPERHGACDRHIACFGRPRHPRWALLRVTMIKRLDRVAGPEILGPDPLARVEGALCRRLNADHTALVRACSSRARVQVEHPMAVGVDRFGVLVRARFGVIRLEFEHEAGTPELAERALAELLA
ncbi:MAG: hypothetical protein DYG92_08390 [Leptolyngbya sp. PLA1]|nr:hypothetical protein [Leptolyngbya sp. PLA1]